MRANNDSNGNLRYEKQPNGTVIREYRWDQQNRLVRFLQGTHESVYEYDGESHRVRIKELESSVETKNETFVWCGSPVGWRICQKRASNGSTVIRSYFPEGFEEGSSDYFYTRDHLASVREVVGSNGTTIGSRLGYGPWGAINESGSGALSDFGFTAHHFDRPSGLGLTWYRGYDPSVGRWLSMDPIGLAGGLNVYGYVDNDPGSFADPTGQSKLGDIIACALFPLLCSPAPLSCSPPGELQRCQSHAGDDWEGWGDYCNTIAYSKRASCHSHHFSTPTERNNWCYEHFGSPWGT